MTSNAAKVTVTAATLESITISPSDTVIHINEIQEFRVNGIYSDGSIHDITKDSSFVSSDTSVVTIVGNVAKAISDGNAEITATAGPGITAVAKVTVPKATLEKIQLTFANGETSVSVPKGTTGAVVATAVYSDGTTADVTNQAAYIYDAAVVDIQSNGNAVAVGIGSSDITAKFDGVTSNAAKVTVTAATLDEIQVQPNQVGLYLNEQIQMLALGTFSDGSIRDITTDVIWESNDVNIASVDSKGVITATGDGVVNVYAKSPFDPRGVKDYVRVAVSTPQLISLKIVRDDNMIFAAGDDFIVGETLKLKALGDFDDGTKDKDITQYVTWTAGPEGTVSVDQNGLVTALKAGNAQVTAAYNGVYGNASDTITGTVVEKTVEKIEIFADPANAAVPAGENIKLEAWATYNDGSNQNVTDTVKWTSSDPKVIIHNVKDEKYVYATANEIVTATIEVINNAGQAASHQVTFEEKVVDHIEIQEGYCGNGNCPVITGKTVDIPIVDDVNYDPVSEGAYYPTAWVVYSDGTKDYINTKRGIRWWSADQIRAFVDTTRGSFVFGRGVGNEIEISVTYKGEHKTSFYVNVKEDTTTKTLKEIGIINTRDLGWGCTQDDTDYGEKLIMIVGDSGKYLQACGKFKYSDGSVKWEDINDNVAWFSADSDIARVSTYTGELKAMRLGNTVISAHLAEVKGSIDVSVVGKTPDHIEIQEGYCEDGKCPIITGQTKDIPIVDDVNYDPVSEGAYYPTAWLVYEDGSKEYINTADGIRWWSADQIRAFVDTTRGSFVFGRGVGNEIEISVSYRGENRTSFYVNVYEDTSGRTLKKIGIKNTKDLGWGCTQSDADYGTKLTVDVGDNGKYLMACGQFEYTNGTIKWEDINDNVAWFSTDKDVAYVRTTTGKLKAIGVGNATISAQVAEIKGQTDVTVNP